MKLVTSSGIYEVDPSKWASTDVGITVYGAQLELPSGVKLGQYPPPCDRFFPWHVVQYIDGVPQT